MARITLTEQDRLAEKYRVTSHWNLLTFVECSFCKDRYIRERGWKFSYDNYMFPWPVTKYVCTQCCSTKESATSWAEQCKQNDKDWLRSNRPPPPKAPPPLPPRMRVGC